MDDLSVDLSIASLMRLCEGNVKRLPSFMVHDNTAWPWRSIRPDSAGRIHLSRATFERVVAGQVPIRPGVWHRMDMQEMHIDLQPHHLQGSDDARGGDRLGAAHGVALVDADGWSQGDEGYGESAARDHREPDAHRDAGNAALPRQGRGIRSTVFDGGSD